MTTVIANHYEIIKWTKNMKFTLKYSKRLAFKLFLMQWTNYHNIWTYLTYDKPN